MTNAIGTTCVQGGYRPGDAEPRQVSIYQSTTWKYDTSEHMGRLFDLEEPGYFYSRLQNPTCDHVVASSAIYGGTYSLLAHTMGRMGLECTFVATHVADARTCCLHPANATHRQMNDAELEDCGISPDMVRLSCGLEDADDLIADLDQVLAAC